jgi:hypothetical protein
MSKQTATVGGARVVFRVFDVNLGVFRRTGCSVHIKGGRRSKGDIQLANTYYAWVDGIAVDVATVEKARRDVSHCSQAEVWVGLSATIDTDEHVSPGGAPEAAVDGVRAAATVTVNGDNRSFTGET